MGSSLDGATRALETRLAQAFPTTPIAWPNVEFAAPVGQLWMRPWTLWGTGSLFTMRPEGMNAVVGIYQVSIFSPLALGAALALTCGDQVRDLFNRQMLDMVECNASSGPVTLPEEPPWYGVAVSVPFVVHEQTWR